MKINFYNKIIISASIILLADFSYAQNDIFENFNIVYSKGSNKEAEIELKKIDTSKISKSDLATWLFFLSNIEFYNDNHHKAYNSIKKSIDLFHSLDKESDVIDCYIVQLAILSHQNNLNIDTKEVEKKIEEYTLKTNDNKKLLALYKNLAINFLSYDLAKESIEYFNKTIPLAYITKDTLKVGHAYANIAIVHNTVNQNLDSALYYNQKAESILKEFNDLENLAYNYNNQADIHKQRKNYKLAIRYYLKADSIPLNKFEAKSKIIFYENISDVYQLNKDYKNALIYLDKLNSLKDSLNNTKQNIAISEIQEKYNNEKLKASNLEIENKRKQNQNIAIGLAGSLVLGGIIAFLYFKNTKRKQKLAEQEKALETQKLATVLKEQELKAIDAMIEGQEKERQRIANDLHDDLGGLMATVKLHFNALKEKQTPELYEKTNNLIDDAYQKVRTIAHAKNSGVIAKQGLLKAVNEMTENISASNKLTIDVFDHGLENRLENSLELTIFRIIQELVTNIIKHAEASEVTIHITNHEDSLNIMVEDNGKGFNPSQITKTNKGMGIRSIDKRVEHLDGSMTIESEKNKGTTIIIDIPI